MLELRLIGRKVPLLDGSAQVWDKRRSPIRLSSSRIEARPHSLRRPRTAYLGASRGCFCPALPSAKVGLVTELILRNSAIGNQWYSWSPEAESFATAIAPARTFGLARQVDQLRQAGLIKGGTLENALVCDRSGWLNPPLRFANEPVRHKILDLVGDLSLLGTSPKAHYLAYKASHNLHVQLALAVNSQAGRP